MSRVTNRDNEIFVGARCVGKSYFTRVFNKLKQLEDVEEMCEKISKQPIYKKYLNTVCKEDYTSLHIAYDFSTNHIEMFCHEYEDTLSVEDYGKTWAFTKGELEQ